MKTQNFSGFHTYAWGEENTNQIRNSILAQVAKTDIENAMQSKGLTKVQKNDNPDPDPAGQRRLETANVLQCLGCRAAFWRDGHHHSATKYGGHTDCEPV